MKSATAPPPIELRLATEADAYALWLWANDGATRAASFGRKEIAWEEHIRWLTGCLRSESHLILVARSASAQPVGVIRFDTTDGWKTARLSYAVAPEQRGRGHGGHIVSAGTTALRARHPAAAIWAEVTEGNEPSLRIFRGSAGWMETGSSGSGVLKFWYR